MNRKQIFAFMASSHAGNFSIGFIALLSFALVLPARSFQDTGAHAKQPLQADSDVPEASSLDRAKKLMRTEAHLGADGDQEPARHHNWGVQLGASGELIAQSVKRNIDADMKVFTHGPSKGDRSALHYFQQWSKGAIEAQLRSGEVGPASLIHRDGGHWNAQCSGSHQDEWLLLHTLEDTHVHHQLFRTSARKLQYIAAQQDSDAHTFKVLFADPPVCSHSREGASLEERNAPFDDRAELLDPNDDSVQDCKALFHRTAQENCGKYYSITVLHATEEIIDGLQIDMLAEVAGFHHRVKCAFEVGHGTDAASDVPAAFELSEEKNGMTATLIMSSDLCKVDTESSVTDLDAENAKLLQAHPLGELSFYKGYEHINDDMPQVLVEVDANLASSFDWVTKYPNCFPGLNGVDVVRNQGKCGSCWAFASASAVMHAICIDAEKKGDTVSANEATYKASVQKLLSCNKDNRGCNGGSAFTADSSFTIHGIAKDVDAPYMCGAGDSLKHFESAATDPCPAWPWGADCEPSKANTAWTYGNAGWLTSPGEDKMMQQVVDGNGVYASFIVWSNFMKYKKGIYDKASGTETGGHAAALVGYGSEGGVKYWRIQNSWGTVWGENGFFRFLRGENLCSIEKRQPVRFTAWAGAAPAVPEQSQGLKATCCDIDGSCTDGDNDFCCGGTFYCSGDGAAYAASKGGIMCPSGFKAGDSCVKAAPSPSPPPRRRSPPPPPPPRRVNPAISSPSPGGTACVWTTWSDWSACSYSCGTGDQIRNRTVKVAATNGGTQCPGAFEEARGCNMDACETENGTQNAEGEKMLNKKSGNETATAAAKAGGGGMWLPIGGTIIFVLVICGGGAYAYAQDHAGHPYSGKKDLDDWGEGGEANYGEESYDY